MNMTPAPQRGHLGDVENPPPSDPPPDPPRDVSFPEGTQYICPAGHLYNLSSLFHSVLVAPVHIMLPLQDGQVTPDASVLSVNNKSATQAMIIQPTVLIAPTFPGIGLPTLG